MTTTASWIHCTGIPLTSSSVRNRRRRPQPTDAPPPPTVPDLIITGDGVPDPNGTYTYQDSTSGYPWWLDLVSTNFITAADAGGGNIMHWLMDTHTPGFPHIWMFIDTNPIPIGTFNPYFNATGNPISASL
jgi:hypothetical protein